MLLDQGVPFSAAAPLRVAGWDVLHVLDVGLSRASDATILDFARNDSRIVCTFDADFHALLATSNSAGPSVIRIRREGLSGAELAALLMATWPSMADALVDGAMATLSERTIRVRKLPIQRSN